MYIHASKTASEDGIVWEYVVIKNISLCNTLPETASDPIFIVILCFMWATKPPDILVINKNIKVYMSRDIEQNIVATVFEKNLHCNGPMWQ